jgi:DNA repair exonuclease SbcCD ATPase subunit
MRILRCQIAGFGCYRGKEFVFQKGLNPFCLKNGEGKTTLSYFIKAMLYSLEKSTKFSFEREHYKPYEGGVYGGAMEIEIGEKRYRIERTFGDSPTKDTLKIYDEKGNPLSSFLVKPLSEFQGAGGALLGELILGVDEEAFKRSSFVSGADLDFSANESIKNRIGNIVIDKDKENSFEATVSSIKDDDLREKKPTKNNENAYPFRIKELTKQNKNNEIEIKELEKKSSELNALYEHRDALEKALKEIEGKQRQCEEAHVKKGQLSTVEGYEADIKKEERTIAIINAKYQNNIPSSEETESLSAEIASYERYQSLERSFDITPAEIERLESLEGKLLADEEYEALLSAKAKIEESAKGTGLTRLDNDRLAELKARFLGKEGLIKDESALQKEYFQYASLEKEDRDSSQSKGQDVKDAPSENVLRQIEIDVRKYNEAKEDVATLKASYKEPSITLKIILFVVTLGFYSLVLKNKRKAYQEKIDEKEKEAKKMADGLDEFFAKLGKASGSYELRIEELRDEARKADSRQSPKALEQLEGLKKSLESKKRALLVYFASFGYALESVEENYDIYKKELKEYQDLAKEESRNKEIEAELEACSKEAGSSIKAILEKHGILKKEDLSKQLQEIKGDIDFYKQHRPLYVNKKESAKLKKGFEDKIAAFLRSHQVSCDNDPASQAKALINDVNALRKAKERKIELQEKKECFIKEYDLLGFIPTDLEKEEESLRTERQRKEVEINEIDKQVEESEQSIARKEAIQSKIEESNGKIKEYEELIHIAEIALSALEEAHTKMEETYIDPIKNSFIAYACKIHEKIGVNVTMDDNYLIRYDIVGGKREAKNLSEGEKAIMMLSLRFAVLDSMYKKRDSLIVLDDPFASLDSEKLPKAIALLKELSKDWQIIYFTCHESREIR